MAKHPSLLTRIPNRISMGLAAASLLLILGGGLLALKVWPDTWDTPFAYVFGYEARGVIYNRLTGERLNNVRIECSNPVASSNARGHFSVNLGDHKTERCTFSLPGFEVTYADIKADVLVNVLLTPNPAWTVTRLIEWEAQGRFDKQYDLLHPDVNRSWSREEYGRLLGSTFSPVLDFKHAEPYYVSRWDNFGDAYQNVAIVPSWVTYERDGKPVTYYWEAHLARENGLWHWFREPMVKMADSGMRVSEGYVP